VAGALESDLDLATAWERLREAEAVAARAGSDLFPDLDAEAEASLQRGDFRQDFDDGDDGDDFGRDGDSEEELRLGLAARYEVDLWGRLRSRVDAERYRAEASLADYRTAALSLSAEVTRGWFQLVETRSQLALLEEQITANEKVLTLLENRFGTGQVRGVDVLRQRQLVEATREQRITVEARLAVLEHLLAVLLGRPPRESIPALSPTASAAALPELPPLPATGVPAELVRRRPDVRSAHLRLRAADRELADA